MKTNYILRLYACFFYEFLIQIALWFLVAFITIFISKINSIDQPHIFQLILWLTSGVYFVSLLVLWRPNFSDESMENKA